MGSLGPALHRIIVSNAPESIANLSPLEPLIPPESQAHAVSEPERPTNGQPKPKHYSERFTNRSTDRPNLLAKEQPLSVESLSLHNTHRWTAFRKKRAFGHKAGNINSSA